MFSSSAFATALSANRDTPELKPGNLVWLTQGSNVIYAGSIVAVNSSGVACPAADATGYDVVGRAEVYQDNTGANYLATKTINVRRGVFKWENGDSITDADIGSLVYVTDDQTVQKGASSYNIIAGVVVKYESTGVWVDTHDIGAQGAATPSSLAVAGNGTVSGNFGVSSNVSVGGNANIAGTLTSTGTFTVAGNVNISSNLNVTGTHTNTGNTAIGGTLGVTGILSANSNLAVAVNETVGGTLGVTGVATFSATPVFTSTTNSGSITASALNNLPASCISNATFFKLTINGTNCAVPVYPLQ